MGKVIRINDKNIQYIEDCRELFAKVKFAKEVYWDDNRILTMALANLIWDLYETLNEDQKLQIKLEREHLTK